MFASVLLYNSQRMVLMAIGDLVVIFLVYLVWIALDNITGKVHQGIHWKLGLDLVHD